MGEHLLGEEVDVLHREIVWHPAHLQHHQQISDPELVDEVDDLVAPERLVITTDCGFGREGLSRRIAYYKCVSMVEGTNIVRRELGLPEARVRAADPKLYFATGGGRG